MKNLKFLWITVLSLILTFSCSSDDNDNPLPVNEEEVITTVRITLTPQGGGTTVVFQSQDLDGDGPNTPVVTISDDLISFADYNASIEILNELENPAEDITIEVEEEDEDHQFFYSFSNASNATVTYTDADEDGNPVGLSFILSTDDVNTETLVVTLRHELNKFADGVSDGIITNAGGETDVETAFTFNVSN